MSSSQHDARTARALAVAGTIGLVGLPALMLASVILEAPFAGPAVIAIGYLGAAHALLAGRGRQAGIWMTLVLGGFVGWSLVFSLARQDPSSWANLAALLMAPAFAAAPAVTRRMTGSETGGPTATHQPLTAMLAGQVAADPQPRRPACAPEPALGIAFTASAASAGSAPDFRAAGEPVALGAARAEPAAHVQDAICFALRQVGRAARLKGVSLVSSGSPSDAAACDRQVCRRILTAFLGEVVRVSPLGGSVHVLARDIRGAILVRVSCANPTRTAEGASPPHLRPDFAGLHAMLDEIGGTLIIAQSSDGLCASVRLARARATVTQGPPDQSSGAA